MFPDETNDVSAAAEGDMVTCATERADVAPLVANLGSPGTAGPAVR